MARGYPWAEWMDGELHVVTRGTDYRGNNRTFIGRLRYIAKQNGKAVTAEARDENTVMFKFADAAPTA